MTARAAKNKTAAIRKELKISKTADPKRAAVFEGIMSVLDDDCGVSKETYGALIRLMTAFDLELIRGLVDATENRYYVRNDGN